MARMRAAAIALLALVACGAPAPEPSVATGPLVDAAPPPPKVEAADASVADAAPPAAKPEPAHSEYADLVRALDATDANRDREKVLKKTAFDNLRTLADPRSADGLVAYLAKKPAPRWRTQAAFRLAELGDLRAAEHLAWRIEQDPLRLYDEKLDPELRQDDGERVVAARLLSDLATIHPEAKDALRQTAEKAVLGWLTSKPQPHANGIRFLALVGSTVGTAKMRAWADPPLPLPKAGAQQFPAGFATAQVALRWLGRTQRGAAKRDEATWSLLVKQLGRRPKNVDATMDALLQGGTAVLGMTLRAYGVGAAQGFAEWGDAKAFPLLLAYVEDEKNNEQARIEACAALGSLGTDADMQTLVPKVLPAATDMAKQIRRACLLDAFSVRRVTGVDSKLVPLLTDRDETTRKQAAIAIGHDGIDADAIATVRAEIDDPVAAPAVRLALLLGGTPADAELVATRVESSPSALEDLKVLYNQTVSTPPTDAALANGSLGRWAANAQARDWMMLLLERGLVGSEYDSGPHTLTHVVLRAKLLDAARGGDASALLLLQVMKERGALASLGAPLSPSSDPR